MKSLFERILEGELPGEKLYEDPHVFAIKDKYPKAPIHVLIIPKKRIAGIQHMEPSDFFLLGEMVRVAQELALSFKLEKGGYRLVINQGPAAGQTIFHLHMHLLGGRPLGEMVE